MLITLINVLPVYLTSYGSLHHHHRHFHHQLLCHSGGRVRNSIFLSHVIRET